MFFGLRFVFAEELQGTKHAQTQVPVSNHHKAGKTTAFTVKKQEKQQLLQYKTRKTLQVNCQQ